MKIKKILCMACSAVILFISVPFDASAREFYEAEYAENEVVFSSSSPVADVNELFTASVSSEYIQLDYNEMGIETVETVSIDGKSDENYNKHSENQNEACCYVAKIKGNVRRTCKALQKEKGILYAEPNYILNTLSVNMPSEITNPSDIYKNYQKWYLNDSLNIPSAWQEFETFGENTVIAIIDNGFFVDAYDFPVNLWTDSNGNHGWNTALDNNDISPIYKSTGDTFSNTEHGSNVAGVIGMKPNTGSGIGAAYNAQLMLLQAARYSDDEHSPGFKASDVAEAVSFAVRNGADIINMSLGATVGPVVLKRAIDEAYNSGVAVFAAAGNGYVENGELYPLSTENAIIYPAGYSNVIGVMAIDKTNPTQLARFSNFDPSGKYYDIAAPGVQIIGCSAVKGKLSLLSGTSQASPLAAACAAMYLSEYPDTTVEKLYAAIRNSSTKRVSTNSDVTAESFTFSSLDATELLRYGKIKPQVNINLETSCTTDRQSGYIYGFDPGFTDVGRYITVTEGTGSLKFTPNARGNGTGSLIEIFDIYGELYESYTVVIFGDTDGDAFTNGQDAVLASAVINEMSLYAPAVLYAADVDFNGTVNMDDYNRIINTAVNKDFIDQVR